MSTETCVSGGGGGQGKESRGGKGRRDEGGGLGSMGIGGTVMFRGKRGYYNRGWLWRGRGEGQKGEKKKKRLLEGGYSMSNM